MACCYWNQTFHLGMLFSICWDAKRRIGKDLEGDCRDLSATAILTIAGRLSKSTIQLHSTLKFKCGTFLKQVCSVTNTPNSST
jgi:hypothetical protein